MFDDEKAAIALLSRSPGTSTLLGSSGAVKERIRHAQGSSEAPNGSCGGVGGGWGNSPDMPVLDDNSCGGVGGGWGNSPHA